VISDWRGVLVSTPVVTSVDVVSLAFGIGALAGWVPAWREPNRSRRGAPGVVAHGDLTSTNDFVDNRGRSLLWPDAI